MPLAPTNIPMPTFNYSPLSQVDLSKIQSVPDANFSSLSEPAPPTPFEMTPWGALVALIGSGISSQQQENVLNERLKDAMFGLNQQKQSQSEINDTVNQLVNSIKSQTPAQSAAEAQKKYTSALNSAMKTGSSDLASGNAYSNASAQNALQQKNYGAQLSSMMSAIAGPNSMRRNQGYQESRASSALRKLIDFANQNQQVNDLRIQSVTPNAALSFIGSLLSKI